MKRYSTGPVPITQAKEMEYTDMPRSHQMMNFIHKMDAEILNSMGIRDTHMSQSMSTTEIHIRHAQAVAEHEALHKQFAQVERPTELYGFRASWVIFDDYLESVAEWVPNNRSEKDWSRTQFKQDTTSSTPSDAKRAKLRAKRKKRK